MLEIVANWMSGWIDSYILGSNEAVSFAAACYLTTQASSGVLNNSPKNNMLRRSHMVSFGLTPSSDEWSISDISSIHACQFISSATDVYSWE